MVERTLVLLKPDAVQRSISGRILQRFEDAGFKIIGMKMVWADKDFAKKHYFDLEQKAGAAIFKITTDYLAEGPVIAIVLEGHSAVEIVRKMVGVTNPRESAPGTIRGDFTNQTREYTNEKVVALRNLVHASGKPSEAEMEIKLWFTNKELHSYKNVNDFHLY